MWYIRCLIRDQHFGGRFDDATARGKGIQNGYGVDAVDDPAWGDCTGDLS